MRRRLLHALLAAAAAVDRSLHRGRDCEHVPDVLTVGRCPRCQAVFIGWDDEGRRP